jgi:hypothetical protein
MQASDRLGPKGVALSRLSRRFFLCGSILAITHADTHEAGECGLIAHHGA